MPTGFGPALFFDPAPRLWDANLLAATTVPERFDELARVADDVQRDLPHRSIVIDGDTGAPLAAQAEAAGWAVDTHVAMVAGREPDRDAERFGEQVAPETVLRVRRRSLAEEFPDELDIVDSIVAWDAAVGAAAHELAFASFADDGWMAGYARLFRGDEGDSGSGVGQIEDVSTLAAYRNQGHARAVVLAALHASRAAGHDLTFLWADEDDWPVALYRRLGFDVAGRRRRLRRMAAANA